MDEYEVDDKTIERSKSYAFTLLEDIQDELPDEVNHGSIMFTFFIYTIHALLQYGWTKDELLMEVHTHEALESTERAIQ